MENRFSVLNTPDPGEFRQKFKVVLFLLLVIFSVLLIRLWFLQIIKTEELQQRSESNAVRYRKIQAMRGLILDRNGVLLAGSLPSFNVVYMPGVVKDHEQILNRLKSLYEKQSLPVEFDSSLPKSVRPYMPIKLEENIGMEKVAVVETNSLSLTGVYIDVSPVRRYPKGEMMAPIIGYTGEVCREDLKKEKGGYTLGDISGRHGVERVFDEYIRGKNGAELIEVNVYEREIKNLGRIDPVPGNNVVMSVDAGLQKVAWEALKGKAGAVVALDPRDGAILAMVSAPSFDPHLFNVTFSPEQWRGLLNNPRAPMINRAISGQYPPGSVYKLIVAAAALEEGVISPDSKILCTGAYRLGSRTYRCWRRHGHGKVDLHRAIVESCDVYFYNTGRMLGVDTIAKYARLFGLGSPTGINLPNEMSGIVPSQEWKLSRMEQPWLPGETISISIGQGYNLATPLQLANAYAALANGGTFWKPYLVRRVETIKGRILFEHKAEKIGTLSLSNNTIELLKNALWGAVNDKRGTGRAARIAHVDVSGKTGTSQVVGLPQDLQARKEIKFTEFQKDHALFVCFAPRNNPEIVIAVVVEHGGQGGSVAAPIARRILNAYFAKKDKEQATMAKKASDSRESY
ncbi:MAG TPA: penicillin-binding protein 2 [Deltaproteobacteria bacterium]|nr:penicillin-binding protein 2 [Deltaproteobacteria bacterium]